MPGFLQAGDAGVGVLGRRIVVAPVDQRGDAVVELVQRPGQGGDVDVLGREHRGRGRHGRGGNIPAASSWRRPSAAPSARCACGR